MESSHHTPPQALFRFHSTEAEEPIEVIAPASLFNHYLRYDNREYHHVGPLKPLPPGYGNRVVCGWVFEEILVRDMHPGNGGPLAHCIVCGAPFPLHTIRCGTAS